MITDAQWAQLLTVVHQTRESIAYLANLSQNGKDECRVFDHDWRETSEQLAALLDFAGMHVTADAERKIGEGS